MQGEADGVVTGGVERGRPGSGLEPDSTEFARTACDLDRWHLGVIADGPRAEDLLRRLAEDLGRDLGSDPDAGVGVASFGGPRRIEEEEIAEVAAAATRGVVLLSVGEPGHGLAGLRATRRQARVAHRLALGRTELFCRYRDVAVLAAVAESQDLTEYLLTGFLLPICDLAHGVRELPRTLRVFIDSRCDIPSAAAALGVDRQAVAARIRLAEELIGRPLDTCLVEVGLALRIGELA